MVQLGILITHQHRLLSVAAMLDVFDTANQYQEAGKPAFFRISLLYPSNAQPVSYSNHPAFRLPEAPQQDLIMIPAFSATGDIPIALQQNAECIPWLVMQHKRGAEIAGSCTGAFLLAATGLLDNKPATTHVQAAYALAKAFPNVCVNAKEVTTFQQGIYTSGGATNSFHLLLRVLEKYCGQEIAIRTAKYFAIDMNRAQQSYFSTFQPAHQHHDQLVSDLQRRIESSFHEAETLEELLAEIPASRRNLARRFKATIGVTPIEYLQKTRIEAAKGLLERTDNSVQEVMFQTGYNDQKSFRQLFRKNTGMTPTEYREKFTVHRLYH